MNVSLDEKVLGLFDEATPVCRWCGSDVHVGSFQVQCYNGGVLFTPLPPDHPRRTGYDEMDVPMVHPHIYCGCGDACMARDLAFGLDHLKKLGVVD